jgi:hypothetical protein
MEVASLGVYFIMVQQVVGCNKRFFRWNGILFDLLNYDSIQRGRPTYIL